MIFDRQISSCSTQKLPQLKSFYHPPCSLIRKRLQFFCRIVQFLAYLNFLRTMSLTFAAANTLRSACSILSHSRTLKIFHSARRFLLRIHCIITAKCPRYIHSLRAGHTISTPCTAHFHTAADFFTYLFHQFFV